jgi:hypothetical protein
MAKAKLAGTGSTLTREQLDNWSERLATTYGLSHQLTRAWLGELANRTNIMFGGRLLSEREFSDLRIFAAA